MRIIFCDVNEKMVSAFKEYFKDQDVIHGNILDQDVDCVVSPANSFGFMDGGIDLAYMNEFGKEIEERVQNKIIQEYEGELLVGQAFMIPTYHSRIPIMITAPTMRVPSIISDPNVIRMATRAAVKCALRYNKNTVTQKIDTMAFPGMGTGVGRLAFREAAAMMFWGIRDAYDATKFPKTWHEAVLEHKAPILSIGVMKKPS